MSQRYRDGGADEGEWRAATDKKSGRVYYYNTFTKATTWNKPLELASPEERRILIRQREETLKFFRDMESNIHKLVEECRMKDEIAAIKHAESRCGRSESMLVEPDEESRGSISNGTGSSSPGRLQGQAAVQQQSFKPTRLRADTLAVPKLVSQDSYGGSTSTAASSSSTLCDGTNAGHIDSGSRGSGARGSGGAPARVQRMESGGSAASEEGGGGGGEGYYVLEPGEVEQALSNLPSRNHQHQHQQPSQGPLDSHSTSSRERTYIYDADDKLAAHASSTLQQQHSLPSSSSMPTAADYSSSRNRLQRSRSGNENKSEFKHAYSSSNSNSSNVMSSGEGAKRTASSSSSGATGGAGGQLSPVRRDGSISEAIPGGGGITPAAAAAMAVAAAAAERAEHADHYNNNSSSNTSTANYRPTSTDIRDAQKQEQALSSLMAAAVASTNKFDEDNNDGSGGGGSSSNSSYGRSSILTHANNINRIVRFHTSSLTRRRRGSSVGSNSSGVSSTGSYDEGNDVGSGGGGGDAKSSSSATSRRTRLSSFSVAPPRRIRTISTMDDEILLTMRRRSSRTSPVPGNSMTMSSDVDALGRSADSNSNIGESGRSVDISASRNLDISPLMGMSRSGAMVMSSKTPSTSTGNTGSASDYNSSFSSHSSSARMLRSESKELTQRLSGRFPNMPTQGGEMELIQRMDSDNSTANESGSNGSNKRPRYDSIMRQRRNSTGTIFVASTMEKQDNNATIECVCIVIRAHMIDAAQENVVPLSEYNIFRDSNYRIPLLTPENSSSEDGGGGNGGSNVQQPQQQATRQNSDDYAVGSGVDVQVESLVPSLETVKDFFMYLFSKSQLESDCIIMALIYCERLVKETKGKLCIRYDNWRSILFACLVMASKVWDDLSMWNIDFSQVYPSFDLARVNELELALLNALKYSIRVSASEYAKYYFLLRSMMTRLGLKPGEPNTIRPLDLAGAKKLQLSTEKYLEECSVATSSRRRFHSMAEGLSALTMTRASSVDAGTGTATATSSAQRTVALEQLIGKKEHTHADGQAAGPTGGSYKLPSPKYADTHGASAVAAAAASGTTTTSASAAAAGGTTNPTKGMQPVRGILRHPASEAK